ncbi:MAG: hypothetical protein K0S20_89, partial [Patescibacteria group bacterium]|nr:hypothetical protein [Patescibacteria group bacterium]
MGIYLDIIRFNFLRFLAYPIEIWAAIVKRGISLGFLIAFWTIVANSSNGRIDLIPLISYFLISNAINDIVSAEILRFGKSVGDTVKKGTITNYLIKPVPIVPYLYASTLGERSVSLLLSIASLIAGLILNPPASLFSVGIF